MELKFYAILLSPLKILKNVFRQGRIKIIRDDKFAGTQSKRARLSGSPSKISAGLDFSQRLIGFQDKQCFARLNAVKIPG